MDRHITTTLLITVAVLKLGHVVGLLMSSQFYMFAIIGSLGVEIGWNLVAIIPAAIAGIVIFTRDHRAGYWAWILAPGIAIWVMRPFGSFADGWQLHGIVKFIQAYGQQVWPVIWHGQTMTPHAIAFFVGAFLMVTAGASISGFTIRQFKKDMRRAGRGVGRGHGGATGGGTGRDGLPQARWASRREVRDNFSHEGGIVLGEHTDPVRDSRKFNPAKPRTWGRQGRGHLITMDPANGNGHVLVTSQASAYKTTGIVQANILNYDGPLVVFDPKCELFARLAKARGDMGFNPVVIDANNGFDPARLISLLAKDHPSAYLRMARMMIPRHFGSGVENGQFFKDAATALFTGLIGYYAENKSTNIVGDVARTLSLPPNEIYKNVEIKLEKTEHAFIINRLKDLEGMESRFFHSVKTEITNNLLFAEFDDIQKYATMPGESPLLAQLVDPRTDIFLNIPQHVAEDFAPMLRLMLGSFLVSAQLIEVNEAPRARRLLIIDEAAKLGNMDILENIRDRGRSIGLHLMMFYQTPGEIAKIWGREGMSSWRDGCSATVMGPVSARESAQDLSTMLGTRTVRVTTEGSSSQHQVMSPMGGSVGSSESEQLRDVPLISPTMISQLPRHASIISVPGFRPILATKAIAFTRKDMKDRVLSTDDIVAQLDVSENQRMLLDRLGQQQQANNDDSTTADDGGVGTGAKSAPASSAKETPSQADPRKKPAKSPSDPADASVGRQFISFARRHLSLRASKAGSATGKPGGSPAVQGKRSDAVVSDAVRRQAERRRIQKGDKVARDRRPKAATDKQATPAQSAASVPTVIRPQDCYPSHPDRAQICAAWFGIPAEQLVFAWTPEHVPGWLRPAWDLWALYMVQRPNTPLNLRNVTHEIIPHPRNVTDGLWIIRMWDRIDWYFSHPDCRYEVYDLKRRQRQWDGLEWRLHLMKCWIRNEPRGLPPALQPSTDYPDHDTLRIRISPATRTLEPTNTRYDPVANAVWLPHTDKGPAPPSPAGLPPPSAEWDPRDIGPVPPDPPPQLIFEHVAAAGFTIVDGIPVAGDITDRSDDPLEWPKGQDFMDYMRVRIRQDVFVESILRHRNPLHEDDEDDMAFFKRFPEVPRQHAARSGIAISNSNVPLKDHASVLWIDRVGDEWRLFRQATRLDGYPLGAARTWPLMGYTLEWLDKPIVERSVFDDAWA